MDQHVISRWLLRAFAGPGDLTLYDKTTDDFAGTTPDDFLVEVDAHSAEIEKGIEAIETPASQAALRLAKRLRPMRPGLYAMVDEAAQMRAAGDELADGGVIEGMRLMVSQFHMPSPSQADRLALATYIGLMYQRAPKVETSMIRWGLEYDRAAQAALDRLLPGFRTGLQTLVPMRRSRMLGSAEQIGVRLAAADWWVIRPTDEQSFVLGDCPVSATLALGHDDDTWHAIFADESYVVVMALGPKIALMIAPQIPLIPISNVTPDDLTRTINRLTWRSAERYVLGRNRATLDAALPGADAALRTSTVEVALEEPRVAEAAVRDVERIVADLTRRNMNRQLREVEPPWQHWDGCRLRFGWCPPFE